MLKKEITYEDLNGNTVSETFYFNLSRVEIIRREANPDGGLHAAITKIIETKDHQVLVEMLETLILSAYGLKSEDGRRFIKTDELRKEFSDSLAYDQLFMDLATDETMAANFINGIIPKGFIEEMTKLAEKADQAQRPLNPVKDQNGGA